MKKNNKTIVGLILTLILIISVSGCSSKDSSNTSSGTASTGETQYPLTITDDLGNEVTIEKEPERIVSLAPANTEILFALGLNDKIVGRTDYCNYPEEAKNVESIGDFNAPNTEKILSMTPDLILSSSSTFLSDDVRSQIESTGAKVVTFDPQSIDAVEKNIQLAGQITNTSESAQKIIDEMETKRAEIKEKTAGVSQKKKVFIDIGEYYAPGAGSLLDSMLKDINAENISGDVDATWAQLSTEKIIAANPDVYISLFTPVEDIKKVPGFDQMKAVKENQIVFYEALSPDSDLIQRGGPRIVDGLALLAENVYPELMK